jgi:hypothetical protein
MHQTLVSSPRGLTKISLSQHGENEKEYRSSHRILIFIKNWQRLLFLSLQGSQSAYKYFVSNADNIRAIKKIERRKNIRL